MDSDSSSNSVFLQNSGKFFNKNGHEGEVSTIWNYPIRGHLWKVKKVCYCARTGDFVTVDERGQIYWYSLKLNVYNLIKKAAAPVAAIDFSPSGTRQLIVAYENGAVLLLDIDTKGVVANVPHLSDSSLGGKAPTSLCSHMRTSVTAIAYARALTLWNLKTMSCVGTLELDNALLGCEFVDVSKACQYIFVVLSTCDAGSVSSLTTSSRRHPNIPVVVIYDCKSFSACAECHFPSYERTPPSYSAYCVLEYTPSGGAMYNKPASSAGTPAKPTTEGSRYVVLGGSNGSLFVWEIVLSPGSASESKNKCVYLGAVDLPVKMQYAVAIQQLGDRDCPPRLGVLSAEGHFIIVDVEGICSGSVGYWTVVSDVAPSTVVGELMPSKPSGPPSDKPSKPVNRHFPCEDYVGSRDKFVAYKEFMNIVGVDGAVRVFNSQLLIGNTTVSNPDSAKNIVGRPLPVREKRRGAVEDDDSEEEAENTVTIKEFKVVGGVMKDVAEEKKLEQLRRKKAKAARAEALARSNQFAPPSVSVTDDSDAASESGASKRVSLVNRAASQKAAAKAAQDEELTLPLFELANIMPRDRVVNEEKLKAFLRKNGSYPERYRPLIWRFLLKLPENQAIFTDLAKRGPHRSQEELYARFPLQNGRLFTRLQATCSMVTHWSEIFGEVPYLPVMAFPFLLVFTRDDLAVLETLITILMWWGYSWQVTFPNPPVHIVNAIDSLLKLHDPKLHYHMSNLNPDNMNHHDHTTQRTPAAAGRGKMGRDGKPIAGKDATAAGVDGRKKPQGLSPGLLGWLMMSTLFTEILGKDSWLAMMDHLFTNVDKVVLMLLAPVAIMRVTRVSLLQTDNYKSANMFFRRQQNVDIAQVVVCMNTMLKTTPSKFLAAIHTPTKDNSSPKSGGGHKKRGDSDEGFVGVDSVQETIADVAVSEGSPVFPLPRSTTNYPAYDGFPKQLVDYQLQNRERTMELHNETVERKKILRQLEMKISAVETEHQRWMAKHKSISQTEIEHRKNMMAKEKAHLVELRSIEEEISKSRITALNVMEEVAKEELDLMDKVADDTRRLMVQGEAHLNEKMDLTVNVQQHRELAVKAEQTSQAHMRQLMMHRTREDWVHGLDNVFKSKEDEMEAKNAILAEEWRIQDEMMKQRALERDEHLRQEAQQSKYNDLQLEMNDRLQKLYLARQAKIMEVERGRAMRLAKEQADESITVAERSALLLQKQELAASAEQDAIFSEKSIQQAQDRLLSSIDTIRDEGERLVEAERVFALKQQQARQRAKVAQLRKEWAEKQGKQLQKTLEAERYAQEQVIRMKKAAARVGVEVEQPVPTSLQGGRKGDVASGAGGNVNDAVDADVQEYYQGAEERLQEVTEKLLTEQRRKFQEVSVSQSPYRETGVSGGGDSDTDSNPASEPGEVSGARRSKATAQTQARTQYGSRATTQAQHGSPHQAKPSHHSAPKVRHPASDSSSDDLAAESIRVSAGRSKDVIFNSEDDDSDESDASARAREVIAAKRVAVNKSSSSSSKRSSSSSTKEFGSTTTTNNNSSVRVRAGKNLNVDSKQLSEIADSASSYLEQFDSTMGGSNSSTARTSGRVERPASAKGGDVGGGRGKPRPGKGYASQYDDRALEAVTDETLRCVLFE